MGILSYSVNLLSKSISKFSSLSSNFRDLKSHHHHHHQNKLEKKLLLIARRLNEKYYYSRLPSIDPIFQHGDLYFPDTLRTPDFFPSASSGALLFAGCGDEMLSSALWNPTTDETKALPNSSIPLKERTFIKSFSFGFDHGSKDYKVIRLLDSGYVDLYSLESDSWKEISCSSHLAASQIMEESCINISGFSYWVTPNFIFSFDFASEEFSTAPHIPLPKTDMLSDPPSNNLLVEFDGSLAILVYSNRGLRKRKNADEGKPFEFEIWVWKDESWTKVASEIVCNTVYKPLCLFNNDSFYFQDLVGYVMVYDLGKRELKNLGLKANPWMVRVLPYVESRERIKQV